MEKTKSTDGDFRHFELSSSLDERIQRSSTELSCRPLDLLVAAAAVSLVRRSMAADESLVVSSVDRVEWSVEVDIDRDGAFRDVLGVVATALGDDPTLETVTVSTERLSLIVAAESGARPSVGVVACRGVAPPVGEVAVLLGHGLRRPSIRLGELPALTPQGEAEAAAAINSAWQAPALLRPIHAAFEDIARSQPDLVAVEYGAESYTYAEVERRATSLASALCDAGVTREDRVGVCVPRGIDLVVAVLAVLKAGGGFVPLDPSGVTERTRLIARLADVVAIISPEQESAFGGGPHPVIRPSAEGAGELPGSPSLDQLACVYFTSGSTGQPKGVALDHRCVAGRLDWLTHRYGLGPGDRLIHKTPLVFDVAIWELFGPLSAGATVLLADHGAEADADHIAHLLAMPSVRFCHFVPSMLNAYLASSQPTQSPRDLEWVQVSGEAVPEALHKRFLAQLDCEFHNMYGQTETSEVAAWELRGDDGDAGRTWVPIGRQIGLYRLFVVDEAMQLVPPGMPGELCVAGVGGLARGYLGEAARTAQSFVPNPWPVEPGERLYRTGDAVVSDESGVLTYLGRLDNQVKVRGCRVEPGEVEAALLRHDGVQECAVVPYEDEDGTSLAVYFTGPADVRELSQHVAQWLPAFMHPAVYGRVDSLPRTGSGKLDRSSLPAPSEASCDSRSVGDEPIGPVEVLVAALWAEVLELEAIGRSDNFFGLGGNSLASLRLLNRVRAAFELDYSTREFFSGPTVAEMAALVEAKRPGYSGVDHPADPSEDTVAAGSLHEFEAAVDPDIAPLLPALPELSFARLDEVRREGAELDRDLRAARGIMGGLRVDDATIAGVPVRIYQPDDLQAQPGTVLWLHGGGFVTGTLDQTDLWCQETASSHGCRVIAVDYALAPEAPYPAAIEDCVSVLRSVSGDRSTDQAPIVLAGASAGGGLAVGAALWARDHNEPLPSSLMLFYPMLDDRDADPETPASSYTRTWHRQLRADCWSFYLGDQRDGDIPIYAAPARATIAQLAGLPPTYIDVGSLDIFRNESIEFTAKLMAAGVTCDLTAVGGAFHGSEMLAPQAATSQRILSARQAAFTRGLIQRD